eukprot:ANDGO_00557.mRNA.1 Nascent polypeptide-associated complex subunit alpha-like protein
MASEAVENAPQPELTAEQIAEAEAALSAASDLHKQSRSEKKTRKAMDKMGLEAVESVTRVTMRRGRQIIAIDHPDVYKFPGTDAFLVYGEARIEDPAAAAQQAAARQFAPTGASSSAPAAAASTTQVVEEDDGAEADETGLDASDISMIMSQANVSRAKAVKALRAKGGDMVEAIMSLTQ